MFEDVRDFKKAKLFTFKQFTLPEFRCKLKSVFYLVILKNVVNIASDPLKHGKYLNFKSRDTTCRLQTLHLTESCEQTYMIYVLFNRSQERLKCPRK